MLYNKDEDVQLLSSDKLGHCISTRNKTSPEKPYEDGDEVQCFSRVHSLLCRPARLVDQFSTMREHAATFQILSNSSSCSSYSAVLPREETWDFTLTPGLEISVCQPRSVSLNPPFDEGNGKVRIEVPFHYTRFQISFDPSILTQGHRDHKKQDREKLRYQSVEVAPASYRILTCYEE